MDIEMINRIDGLAYDLHSIGFEIRLDARMEDGDDAVTLYHMSDLYGQAAQALWSLLDEIDN